MKTFVLPIMILTLMSSYNGKSPNEIKEAIIQNEVYRSTDSSFQKDFYISIENRKVSIYGWEISNTNDTIYYKGNCKLEENSAEDITIRIENYQLSNFKINKDNFNDFKVNNTLSLPILGAHSRFMGKRLSDDSLEFLAVKDTYDSRADNFRFVKIK